MFNRSLAIEILDGLSNLDLGFIMFNSPQLSLLPESERQAGFKTQLLGTLKEQVSNTRRLEWVVKNKKLKHHNEYLLLNNLNALKLGYYNYFNARVQNITNNEVTVELEDLIFVKFSPMVPMSENSKIRTKEYMVMVEAYLRLKEIEVLSITDKLYLQYLTHAYNIGRIVENQLKGLPSKFEALGLYEQHKLNWLTTLENCTQFAYIIDDYTPGSSG